MTLSRTSRILIGFLLLVLAAFLWVNLLINGSASGSGALQFLRAAPSPSEGAQTSQADEDVSVAPVPETRVARELEVLDLPFLVTEPPAQQEQPTEAEAEAQDLAASVRSQRATINPFSPIIQRNAQPSAQPRASQPEPQPEPTVTEVPVPSAPPQTAQQSPQEPVRAPVPAPVTPRAQGAGELPRALPDGTLGGSPDLLRSAIGNREGTSASEAPQAAVREPVDDEPPELADPAQQEPTTTEPEPLEQPVADAGEGEQAAADDEQVVRRPVSEPPLEAGASELSRYLRDNNVRFTGSVIGPVSVGVFRSARTSAPVVISLGQSLPETSIVLTDLRGQQAEFRLGDTTQTLTLQLRR